MTSKTKEFIVKEVTGSNSIPPVEAQNVKQEWLPYQDQLTTTTTDQAATIYDKNTKFNGSLVTKPNELNGSGELDFRNAYMTSNLFKFKNRFFDTDTCDFNLKTVESNELALETKNYKGHVDFDKRIGEFKSNGGTSLVNFPINEYICYMDQFDWHMDKDEIDLKNNEVNSAEVNKMEIKQLADIELAGSEFISIHPGQDSLRFKSSRATYKLNEKIIRAEEVLYIKVADATIFPGDRKVTILRKAEIVPLENAQILANNTTKYHTINNANVNIFGRKSYQANGYYDYIDEMENVQRIFFDKIAVDSAIQTYGQAYISDSINFSLSPFFDYYGNVSLKAPLELLTFKGGTRIKHNCDTYAANGLNLKQKLILKYFHSYFKHPQTPR